ncbi:uncharacterized protein B0H64DRAFT_461548 [Chaetomium fimeti]|uniref:Uncharacterized protein n=1 Tax=Chaetomium fimeti TaxID=1854472 RepID=A0AAE0HH51_9PEZI|nr:hypothetical protein B0H64DRAFT_461548 [Chaetomium fimeti]
MHFSKVLITAAAVFIQGSLAVKALVYADYDCKGEGTDVKVDNSAACDGDVPRFRSYRENGWGPGNGQRIAFYQSGSCTTDSFLYDTYSRNGDYFKSKQCYNIKGHSVSDTAASMKLS